MVFKQLLRFLEMPLSKEPKIKVMIAAVGICT
jgi:hypothetical protein